MASIDTDPQYWSGDDWERKEEAISLKESRRAWLCGLGITLVGAVALLTLLAYMRGYFTIIRF